MLILPLRVELFHADGRTDMTKLLVAFRNSANSLKNSFITVCMQDPTAGQKIVSLWTKKRKHNVK